jgi:hypothetical protein
MAVAALDASFVIATRVHFVADSAIAFTLIVLLIPDCASATLAHMGSLHRGDNLDILHRYLRDAATNLIHLEPPFNSRNSTTFFHEEGCAEAATKLVEARP